MNHINKANPWNRENDESILEIYDVVKGTREIIYEFDYLIEAPNWSKDSKYLIYNSNGKIYTFNLATKEIKEVFSDFATNCNNDHVLSPDGNSIAVSHGTREDGKSRIYILPLAGGVPRLITPLAPSYLHGWSPDGTTLAYCAERNGELDIYTIPALGGEEKYLTDVTGLNDGPEYDPTGKYIWFNSVRTGLMQVWRMKSDGSEQRQMTFDEEWNTWFPHVSPNGKTVVMIAYRKGDLGPNEHLPHKNVELRLMSAEGGEVKTAVKLFGGQGTINVNSWSPDSKKFAFVSYRIREN
ncbi:TolB family protein [Anaerocolumna sp. MB42-C2]|uniref:TolB family protein n=1 Tax=Anaerocolumna sp. MB42-C2 TaxID=3070997 RepID=UPI0027E1BDFB|nr:SMP-30/gluconolactonase/LRE family protein [Anaerocolumna sp. MB42-C2]WMJ87020.1 SMP-30/gluconolactonase/LRE family protein [Anaerocolumna sp. MB42-C2]